jgi:hypothetical protein
MKSVYQAMLAVVLALVVAVGANGASPSIGGYNVYFGQFHSHTSVSDGKGTPSEAYQYARDTAGLDFFFYCGSRLLARRYDPG